MTQPDSPPLLIIIVPENRKRGLSDLLDFIPFLEDAEEYPQEPQDPQDPESPEPSPEPSKNRTAEVCYKSEDDCSSSTTCFGRGSCALKGKNGDDECWGCKCNAGYAGVSCQKEDYSTYVRPLLR